MIEWSTSCKDWEARIVKRQPLITCPVLFEDSAAHSLEIFKSLQIVDMIGRPTIGEVTREWVFDFARVFFGSLDDATNTRHIKEFLMLIAKKNTKSTTAAGIMLTVLITNLRESAEYFIIAPTVQAANNAFKPAQDMIRVNDDLSAIFQVQSHTRTITHRTTGAYLKVIAAESDTVVGSKAAGILIDELWAFGKKKNAASMLTEATGGLMSRSEGFIIYLTTQSDEPPAGIFKEKLDYARDVRDGIIDDNQFLPVLYEYPQHIIARKKYLDPDKFYITNPNLGASVDEKYLLRKIDTAKNGGDENMQQVLAKHLNVEIGLNLRSDRWAGADFWEACGDNKLTLKLLLDRSEVVCVGIDGGGLDDLLGLAVTGRCKDTGDWLTWCYAWAHPSVLERRKEIAPRVEDFAKEGSLTLVNRVGDDVEELCDIVEKIDKRDLLDSVGVDAIGLGSILDELEERGIDKDKIVAIPQGWKMGGAIKTTERRLAQGTMSHSGQKLMNWCVGNARIEQRSNSILVTKQASGTAKIDPLIGVFNSVALMSLNPTAMTEKFQFMVM